MNLDRQLPNSVDINIAPSTHEQLFQLQGGTGAVGVQTGETFVVPVYSGRVSTSFGPVTDMVSNANATYNGLTLEARRGVGSERAGYSGAGRALEFRAGVDVVEGDRLRAESGRGAAHQRPVRPVHGALRQGTLGAGLSPSRGGDVDLVAARWRVQAARRGERALPSAIDRALRAATDGWSLAGIFSEASGAAL